MVRKVLARIFAALALAAVAVGVYLIVHSTVIKPHSTTTSSNSTLTKAKRGRHPKAKPKPTIYVVKAGDTLSSIAEKTGVSLGRLTALNHSVSQPPYSLQTGQRLRLRR
jgi:LysM repeat protein